MNEGIAKSGTLFNALETKLLRKKEMSKKVKQEMIRKIVKLLDAKY